MARYLDRFKHQPAMRTKSTPAAVLLGLALAGAALAFGRVLWSPPVWLLDALSAVFPGCLYRVETSAPVLALTIDDGPDPETTPLILAELERYRAHATFFMISSRVAGQEDLIRDLIRAGHEIGNHLTRDVASIRLGAEEFEAELLEAHRVLTRFGSVTWMRPGSGWYSRAMIETAQRHGYRCALGSVYPFDAAIRSIRWARSFLLRNTGPGSIIILHDGGHHGRRTAQVLATVLPELERRGFRIVTLSELARHERLDPAVAACPRPHRVEY